MKNCFEARRQARLSFYHYSLFFCLLCRIFIFSSSLFFTLNQRMRNFCTPANRGKVWTSSSVLAQTILAISQYFASMLTMMAILSNETVINTDKHPLLLLWFWAKKYKECHIYLSKINGTMRLLDTSHANWK